MLDDAPTLHVRTEALLAGSAVPAEMHTPVEGPCAAARQKPFEQMGVLRLPQKAFPLQSASLTQLHPLRPKLDVSEGALHTEPSMLHVDGRQDGPHGFDSGQPE